MIKIKNAEEIRKEINEFDIKNFMEDILNISYYSIEYNKIVFFPLSDKKVTIVVYLPSVALVGGLYDRSDINWSCPGDDKYMDDLDSEIFGLCLVVASRISRKINKHFDNLIKEEEITE